MESCKDFLSLVIERLLSSDIPLRDQLVVVPTKRSGAFLQRQLVSQIQETAVILPRIITIDEWITEMSGRVILDNTALVSILYEIYANYLTEKFKDNQESKDTDRMLRLSQTERMLRDFQDMDLALANVDMLLGNVEELDAFDDYSFLTKEEQAEIIKFWRTLSEDFFKSELGKEYLPLASIWRDLYRLLNERLASLGVSYRAATYRLLAEKSFTSEKMLRELRRHSGSTLRLVSLVGLYNLTPAEKEIIKKLKESDVDSLQVELYWQEVCLDATGEFTEHLNRIIQQNRAQLGGVVLESSNGKNYAPEVHLLSLNSTILQPHIANKLISQIVKEDPTALSELRIAIVLNDEKTLIPLMKTLQQPAYTSINVTMGYPLQHTSVATWIRRYLNIFGIITSLQKDTEQIKLTSSRLQLWLASPLSRQLFGQLASFLKDNIALHHYTIKFSEIRTILQQATEVSDENVRHLLIDLLTPSLDGKTLLKHLNQLLDLVKDAMASTDRTEKDYQEERDKEEAVDQVILSESVDQLIRYVTQVSNLLHPAQQNCHQLDTPQHVSYLLEQLIAVGSIPFEGDPLEGLQVMGFLETRTLSFDYVIMLNVQEGDLPKSSHTTTLIPDLLRKAAHMATYRTEDDTNAYHFYRLIQGAKKVYLLQDTRPKSISSTEPSRYIDQIRYLTHLDLHEQSYADTLEARDVMQYAIPTSDEHVRIYLEQLNSGEKTFSPSDLITYYKCPYQFYLKKIKGVGEPRPEPGVVTAIELGSLVHAYLERFYTYFYKAHNGVISKEDLKHTVCRDKLEVLYKDLVSGKGEIDDILFTDLKRYILKALDIDKHLLQSGHQLRLLASEVKIDRIPIEWYDQDGKHTIQLTGQPDRVDLLDGQCRIVDYKTGPIFKPKSVKKLDKEVFDTWRQQSGNYKLGGYMLQSYLYALLYAHTSKTLISEIQPTLYSLAPAVSSSQGAISFESPIALDEMRDIVVHYLRLLVKPDGQFTQASPSLGLCKNCHYRTICGRK